MLLKFLNIDFRLSHSCPPAIICQSNAVAKAFDRSLENFILDILNLKLLLKLADEVFLVRGTEAKFTAWPNVLTFFTHVAPRKKLHINMAKIIYKYKASLPE